MVALKKDVCEGMGSVQRLYEKHTDPLKASNGSYIDVLPNFKNVEVESIFNILRFSLSSEEKCDSSNQSAKLTATFYFDHCSPYI